MGYLQDDNDRAIEGVGAVLLAVFFISILAVVSFLLAVFRHYFV